MTYVIKPRELRENEIAIVPFDNNIYFVIVEDKQIQDPKTKYKVQLWNKELNAYSNTSYNLSYYQARNRLAKFITF